MIQVVSITWDLNYTTLQQDPVIISSRIQLKHRTPNKNVSYCASLCSCVFHKNDTIQNSPCQQKASAKRGIITPIAGICLPKPSCLFPKTPYRDTFYRCPPQFCAHTFLSSDSSRSRPNPLTPVISSASMSR